MTEKWILDAGYKSEDEFKEKIEWEGGEEYFFNHYTDDEFVGSPFEKELKAYRKAYKKFFNKFQDFLYPEQRNVEDN